MWPSTGTQSARHSLDEAGPAQPNKKKSPASAASPGANATRLTVDASNECSHARTALVVTALKIAPEILLDIKECQGWPTSTAEVVQATETESI